MEVGDLVAASCPRERAGLQGQLQKCVRLGKWHPGGADFAGWHARQGGRRIWADQEIYIH
eukprot:6983884-Pyramimonas_sp.AAC.1